MAAQDRNEKYQRSGGGDDLVRAEVLASAERPVEAVDLAARLQADERAQKARLTALCEEAMSHYRTRILDTVHPERLPAVNDRASESGRASCRVRVGKYV